MNRRNFLATALSAPLLCYLPKTPKVVWEHKGYRQLPRGYEVWYHTVEDIPWYVAFIIRDKEIAYCDEEQLWCMYGAPAAFAVARELGQENAFVYDQRKPFAQLIARIKDGRTQSS